MAASAPSESLSRRCYAKRLTATSWEEIWEASSYFERISELLENASSYAIFLGWQIDSRIPLTANHERLKTMLIRLCTEKPEFQVYILMWDHAYFYIFEREIMQGRIWDEIHPRVHFIFDNHHPFGASHHEKVCIIDGKTAFVGGIDLCDERWDSPEHLYEDPRRSLDWKKENHGPYHDLAVQVRGPICGALQKHAARRWRQLSSIPFPQASLEPKASPGDGGAQVYLSRTLAKIDAGRRPSLVREIEFLFRELIQSAEHQLVFEGQYYWSREVNDLLIAKMHERKGKDFTVILVLAELRGIKSLTRYMNHYQYGLLCQLQQNARLAGTRLIVGSPYSYPSQDAPKDSAPKAVYIHSKVLIVDDRYLSVGSANFAARALRIDTEVNLTLEARKPDERAHVRRLIDRIFQHWSIGTYENQNSHVRLRRVEDHMGPLNHIPWERLFDPELPWFYPLKRRIRLVLGRKPGWIKVVSGLLWLLGVMLSLRLASSFTDISTSPWPWLYTTLLASSWLFPVPFVFVAVLASLHLGPAIGPELAVTTAWITSMMGYATTRTFPSVVGRYFRATAPPWLSGRIGLRSFPALLRILMDPRLSFRSKVAFQGLYSVPVPWFLLGTWVILPSALYTACHWSAIILHPRLAPTASVVAPYIVSVLIVSSLASTLRGLKSKSKNGKKTPPGPLL